MDLVRKEELANGVLGVVLRNPVSFYQCRKAIRLTRDVLPASSVKIERSEAKRPDLSWFSDEKYKMVVGEIIYYLRQQCVTYVEAESVLEYLLAEKISQCYV